MTNQGKYRTNSRKDIIRLCEKFSEFVRNYISESSDGPVCIEIKGDYASGKSLVADSIKAALLRKNVEAARWKHSENEDGEIDGTPVTFSFVNARFDFLNTIFNRTINKRSNRQGVIFISNRPRFDIGRIFSSLSMPKPKMTVSVNFPKGETRPIKCGPIEFGTVKEITNRHIMLDLE